MRDAAEGRDPRWYGEDAARTREKAKLTDDPVLRDSYVQLAQACERLAEVMERTRRPM